MISKNKFLKNAQKVEVKQQMETGGILNKVDFIRQAQQAQRRQQDAFETYRAAVEEAKKTRANMGYPDVLSEQEFNRSGAMVQQHGTYDNYLLKAAGQYQAAKQEDISRQLTTQVLRREQTEQKNAAARMRAQGNLGTQALRQQSALLAGRFAPATQQVRGDVDAFHAESQQKGRFGFGTGKELKEGQRGRGKVSEQEFNRSEAMVAQYGSYSNYLRGVYAGYDEAAAAGTKRRAEAALAEGKVSEAEFSRAPAMVEQYGTYRNYLNGVRKSDDEITRERAAKRIESLGISDTLEQYYNAEGEEQAQLRQQLADKGVTGTELNEWRNTVFNQAGQFIGDLAAGFFQGGLLQNMSGMEGALAGLENAANGTVAWALDDLSNPLPSGKLKTGIKSFANQLANADSRHEENARKLQEQNAQVMQQLTQGHSQAAKWIIEQMPSAGNMLLNVGTAGMAGVPNLAALGTTAGGNAYIEAKNDGATNEQALAYGIVNGSLEVLSEKLFGGNPLYDTDAGLVNQLVAKLTDNKTIMRILNSKGFDLLSEGLEEVVTEITEPWAQALIYAGKEAEFATLESVANAFAGGVFLSVVGNLADLPVSMRNREVQSVINDVTERVLYQAEQVADAGVQQAVADVREKMEYGEDVTAEDLGNVLNAMSEADAEVDAETVEAETAQAQEQAQAEADEKTFQIYKSAAETAQENQRLAQKYQQEQEQSRAQQSVQAVQQAKQAAQRQYDQDSLFAPIPGTESMGELDPVQYARQQTADAEQALDEAAALQEEQYLQNQARRAGYDDATAAYFLNGNTTGMPAEQYAQSFGQVYEQGRLGASEQRAMRYAEGMNQDVAAAAYRAGLAAGQKGANNGSIEVTDEGQIGQAGQRAEGQAGGVRQGTAQQQRADAGRKRAQGARDLAKAWDEVELSTLGFGKDNTQKVRVMPKGQEARSEDIQAAEKFFRSMGVQDARFFTGQLTQEIDGQTFYADAAVTEDGSVLIRADSEEYSAFELAKHEGYHLLVKRWPEMAAKIQKRLLGEGKITKEMIESYVDAYAGIYGDDTDAYVEEIIADTYAGMNRTDYGTNKLRADVKMEVGQWQKKSGSARAPPAKMSASKAEKYDFTKPFAEQVDDWKAGKIGKNDTLVVGPTPEVFQKVGFNALPVTINQTHVDYALNGTKNEEHHIGESMLKQLPRAMKSPVAIIESETQRGTSVVALLPFIKDAKTVIIPVYVDGYGRQNSVVIDSNAVTSIYGRKNAVTGLLTNAIEKSNNGETTLFYVDKVKAAALYQVARVTMPKMPDTDNGFVASIRDEGSTVKPKLKNVTQSQQFKRWFGDWQNHPESASKVVNADGTPKVVYHGTSERNGSFTVFDESKAVKRGGLGFKALGKGNYFTATHLTGNERYGSRVIEAYLNIRNPLDVEAGTTFRDTAAEIIGESAHEMSYDELQAEMRERGYDGVIQRNKAGDINIAVAFDSNQIKSATENIGTFDKTNPDIRYSSQEGRYRDLMGEKPAQYTRRAENFLLAKIAGSFGVSSEAKRETLQPFTEQIVRKFLQTGELDNKLVDDLVDAAAEVSMEENQSYYEEYKGILKFIENQNISIPAQDKADVRNWNQFRQQAAKNLNITDDGMPVRDVYWTLHKKAPQLFPVSNKTAGAQIMQIYEVAEGIRQTREWVEGFKGVDAAEVSKVKKDVFEARATNARLDWAKNDARNAVKAFAADLRVTQRYLDRQKKAKDLLGLAIPQSAGEALELSKEVKKLRGRVQYVMNKNLLTAEDQKIVGALLRGDISVEAVRKMKNSKGILDVYEAKAAYDARVLTLRAWRMQNKQRMLDEVDADLDAAKFDQWVDRGSGWSYDVNTPERIIADVMRKIPGGNVLAKEFSNKYIYKIKQNESKRKTFILEIQERVKALDISEKVMKGNADSEAYAVQLLGEAQENAEMLKGQDAEAKKDGKTYEEWLAVIQKLKADNPNMDFAKIDKAITEFHKIYDELLDMINQVRVQFGYDPVSYRRGYFPHFTENEESILARFGRELGFTGTVSPLPTTINGLTSRFRPGIRYFKNANERLGYATAYNAIKGLDLYLDTASDVIFHTEDVQRMRALETQIRYRASDEGIRRQMDAIKANDALDPDQKQQLIDELSKNGRTRMSHMAAWLTEYTNVLAGKRTGADRWLEEHIPQSIYNFMRKSQQRVGANMVAANIGSAVTNFIPLTQAWAQTSTVNLMKGMWYTLANYVQADGMDQQSVFINNRSGYHGLSQSSMDKASEIAGWVMEHIDGFTTGSIVRARVIENMQRGMSQQSALEEADQFASGIMADRSKGATPLMYTVRSPIVKMFTQFQLEVNNELSWIFKDLIPQERKKGVLALVKALLKFAIGAWLYNEAAEAIFGRRPALDPLDMLNDTVGDVSGYKVPNTWQAMAEYGVKPKNWDYTTEKKTPEEVWKGFASRVVDELPNTQLLAMFGLDEWMGLDLQGNRIAVISAFPDMEKVNKALLSSKEDMATKKKAQVLVDELSKPLSYAALPMGGGQARKSLQGIMSVVNGGKYSLNNEGEQQLQYPTYTDRPGDVPLKLAQGVLFGRTATQEAQDWIENGFKSLSVKETKAYQAITESGEDQRKTYTFVQAIKNVEKEYDKKMLLKSYSISDTAKTAYFYQVFANEDQQKEMDKLDEKGKIDYMKKYLAEAEDSHNRDELRDAAVAGTVTQEKAIQRMVANDWAKNEDDAYWKYREWIRKADDKDYKMYDDFLNAIESGGDVKEAAREYLEHGKEAKDLSRQITTAYKEQYLAATPEERRKLKQKLLEIYAALGFNRKEKSKDIDKWVKDAAKEKKDK